MNRRLFLSFSSSGLKPEELGLRHLALPILLEMLLRTTVSMVNVAFLSRLSDQMVSAVSISSQYINILQMIASAVTTGSIVCINQTIEMHNEKKVMRIETVAIASNVVVGLFLAYCFSAFPTRYRVY